jgi:hypothetical protein
MVYNEKKRETQYKWRLNNKEKDAAQRKKDNKTYYEKNKEKYRERARENYHKKKALLATQVSESPVVEATEVSELHVLEPIVI